MRKKISNLFGAVTRVSLRYGVGVNLEKGGIEPWALFRFFVLAFSAFLPLAWFPWGIAGSIVLVALGFLVYISFSVGDSFGTGINKLQVEENTKTPLAWQGFWYNLVADNFLVSLCGLGANVLTVVLLLLVIVTGDIPKVSVWIWLILGGLNVITPIWLIYFRFAAWTRYGLFITRSGSVVATAPSYFLGVVTGTKVGKISLASLSQSTDHKVWDFYWSWDPGLAFKAGDEFKARFVPVAFVEMVEAIKLEYVKREEGKSRRALRQALQEALRGTPDGSQAKQTVWAQVEAEGL